jgi:hypothetical protein
MVHFHHFTQPNRDYFRAILERQFDEHMKLVHPDESS